MRRTVLSSKTSPMASAHPTPMEFRLALGQFATGVTVITAERGPTQVHGMTAESANGLPSANKTIMLLGRPVAQGAIT